MFDVREDIIEDILVDSDLAKKLVPNKFKFTSKQGRVRRQKLLMAAKELCETQPVHAVTLADVCEKADIPRASAYHFFPNIEAIFLALRFLNAIEILDTLETVEVAECGSWQGYVKAVMQKGVDIFAEDITKAKLIYETNTPDFEGDDYGVEIDGQITALILKKLTEYYDIPKLDNINNLFLVAYNIVNSVFTMSYRRNGRITKELVDEAIIAAIAYLRSYFPENLPLKQV